MNALDQLLTKEGQRVLGKDLLNSLRAKTGLNVLIMSRDDLVRYVEPGTDLEKALHTKLKEMIEEFGGSATREYLEAQTQTQSETISDQAETIAELREKIAELESKLVGELV